MRLRRDRIYLRFIRDYVPPGWNHPLHRQGERTWVKPSATGRELIRGGWAKKDLKAEQLARRHCYLIAKTCRKDAAGRAHEHGWRFGNNPVYKGGQFSMRKAHEVPTHYDVTIVVHPTGEPELKKTIQLPTVHVDNIKRADRGQTLNVAVAELVQKIEGSLTLPQSGTKKAP